MSENANLLFKNKDIIRNWLALILIIFFIIISFAFISPDLRKHKSEYRSAELKEVTTIENDMTRVDYVDEKGKRTIAANQGYATRIVRTTEEGKIESFYDDQGNPARRSNGYYQIFRQYDESGNNNRTTYLDIEGQPVIVYGGYATEDKIFDEEKHVIEVHYLGTDGDPIFSYAYGCCKLNEYDENGKLRKFTYVDSEGNPVVTSLGYASVERNYYMTDDESNGRIESEFYFDADGNPIALSLGQYGEHREYDKNGQASVLTYLDAYGNPIVTNKGYTTIKRTFQANNSIATEMYFDLEGNPFAMAEGQYGVNKVNGQTRYLDRNGHQIFNIRNLLYNRSWIVVILAFGTVMLSSLLGKKLNGVLLVLYIGAILYLTLLYRENGASELSFEIFGAYKKFLFNSEARADILKNIWLFIPLGAFLYRLWPNRWVLVVPVLLSGTIEIIQFVTGTGKCELIDVINNGLGAIIGYEVSMGMGKIISYFLKGVEHQKHHNFRLISKVISVFKDSF